MHLESYLEAAESHEASDLFLIEGELVRAKISGKLMLLGEEPLTLADMTSVWMACRADPLVDQDKDTGFMSPSGTRYRVNLYRSMGRLGAVMRRVRSDIPGLESLGVPSALIIQWVKQKSGLLLVTGPTGSGKSTTLAAALQWLNLNQARHVVTIEDPIEYYFQNQQCLFSQREVGQDTVNFAQGLRASLRQAPDVIFVGEIRDSETALTALHAAETGHLVLATMHCERVVEGVDRLLSLFTGEHASQALQLLSNQLLGILCQKLVPHVSAGQTLLMEHFENVGVTRQWIRSRELTKIQDFIESRENEMNVSFLDSVVAAFKEGRISQETAIFACGSETAFRRAVRGVS